MMHDRNFPERPTTRAIAGTPNPADPRSSWLHPPSLSDFKGLQDEAFRA
jgi:hypothetical protein